MSIEDVNNVPKLLKVLEEITNFEIRIGFVGEVDSKILMIAHVNEFGWTIKPKGKRLAIPLNKAAKEAGSPRNIPDLFTFKTDDGSLYLVRNKGKDKLEFMYWLATEVTIPERSFIRGGYDANKVKMASIVENLFEKAITFQITVEQFQNQIGEYCVKAIKEYMTNIKGPANSPITLAGKSPKTNPLMNTGELRQKITYKVVKR